MGRGPLILARFSIRWIALERETIIRFPGGQGVIELPPLCYTNLLHRVRMPRSNSIENTGFSGPIWRS